MYWNLKMWLEQSADTIGLIETWDVLKSNKFSVFIQWFARLIETWDVLKYRNRRAAASRNARLIETWDVLKLAF